MIDVQIEQYRFLENNPLSKSKLLRREWPDYMFVLVNINESLKKKNFTPRLIQYSSIVLFFLHVKSSK